MALPLSDIKFAPDDDVKCLLSAVVGGDPVKGASTIAIKARPGCVTPWHTHTAGEQLVVAKGKISMEMEGMRATTLGPGGFAFMLGKAKHQVTCRVPSECVFFVVFDGPYDIQWVTRPKK